MNSGSCSQTSSSWKLPIGVWQCVRNNSLVSTKLLRLEAIIPYLNYNGGDTALHWITRTFISV